MGVALTSASSPCPHHKAREADNLRPGLLQDGGAGPSAPCSTVHSSRDTEATSTSIDRGMDKKVWHMHSMERYSAIKKHEIVPSAATWRDPEIVILSEVKSDRGEISTDIPYMRKSKKEMAQMNLFTKQKQTHRLERMNLQLLGGRMGRRDS